MPYCESLQVHVNGMLRWRRVDSFTKTAGEPLLRADFHAAMGSFSPVAFEGRLVCDGS